ncbi:TniQ family protein [Streptomyces alboflavus]|uniref:TniQ family protein n=1 Tax=Streptomyces alboflavus TaxID=67267 RepID=UPI0009978B09|nr:TniQ family protein [Streptomyces alboflavus]
MTAAPSRLPMTLRPRLGESTDSYIRRLARANHLTPSYLHGFLCGPPTWFGKPRLTRLAATTGHPAAALQHALADASSPRHRRKPAPAHAEWPEEVTRRLRSVRDDAAHGLPLPILAARHGLDRRMVRLALTRDLPRTRSGPRPPGTVLTPLKAVIDPMADHGCRPREIWTRLMNDYDTSVSLSTIILYLRERSC